MPLVLQYNKRDLPNAMPAREMNAEINSHGVPSFESVATTGLGVEETLKGITQLVLAHLVKKYGLEGSEPIDRDIQILNAPSHEPVPAESLWDDDDEPFGATLPLGARAPAAQPAYDLAEADDEHNSENLPLVATELLKPPAPVIERNPFDEATSYFNSPSSMPDESAVEVPMTSIEIPIPQGILESLPVLGQDAPATTAIPRPPADRRTLDALVKEVTIPLNLTLDEIRQYRRLRLKITLDVNLLP
jgi:hypothetical protein